MDTANWYRWLIQAHQREIDSLQAAHRAELAKRDRELAIQRAEIDYLRGATMALIEKFATVRQNIVITTTSQAMSESTQQNIATGTGSFVNTGEVTLTGSTLNLGTISGAVTNSVQQLRQSQAADAADLATLLSQLQALLEGTDDQVLKPEDKADALEEVKTLAEAAQKPEAEKKGMASKAMRALRRIVDAVPTALPTAAKLLAEFNTLLPTVVKLFGL